MSEKTEEKSYLDVALGEVVKGIGAGVGSALAKIGEDIANGGLNNNTSIESTAKDPALLEEEEDQPETKEDNV